MLYLVTVPAKKCVITYNCDCLKYDEVVEHVQAITEGVPAEVEETLYVVSPCNKAG